MSEYITDERGEVHGEIVRCRDCKHYESSRWYESAIFPPLGTDIEHVCVFFADGVKVEPDGFCAWGKRRGA